MRSLNKSLSLIIFLLINIVGFTRPIINHFPDHDSDNDSVESDEVQNNVVEVYDLYGCLKEIFYEFKNHISTADFLYALLNIKAEHTIDWNEYNDINEYVFIGRVDLLNKVVKGYYLDMYNVLLNADTPPLLPTPRDFCNAKHGGDNYCTSKIAEIGCEANYIGIDCLRHMFLYWRSAIEPGLVPGTENISDKKLSEAVSKGAKDYPSLSQKSLLKRLSDKYLLKDFYRNNKYADDLMQSYQGAQYRSEDYEDYDTPWASHEHYRQHEEHLSAARLLAYGISDVSYEDLFSEYNRRQSVPKPFDKYYAKYLFKRITDYVDSRLTTRESYCADYLEKQSNQ